MSERDDLKARAEKLGLNLPGNISTKNLKAAVEGKEAKAAPGAAPVPAATGDLVSADVLDALKHNGEDYGPGDSVELTANHFDRLSSLGVVAETTATDA